MGRSSAGLDNRRDRLRDFALVFVLAFRLRDSGSCPSSSKTWHTSTGIPACRSTSIHTCACSQLMSLCQFNVHKKTRLLVFLQLVTRTLDFDKFAFLRLSIPDDQIRDTADSTCVVFA